VTVQHPAGAGIGTGYFTIKSSPSTYHVVAMVHLEHDSSFVPSRVDVFLPIPQTDQYQKVSHVNLHRGVLVKIPDSEDRCARFTIQGDGLSCSSQTIICEYDVTLYDIQTRLDRVSRIYGYPQTSRDRKLYTGCEGKLVDPDNPVIRSTADSIWRQSSGVLDYALKCYRYVAENFRYRDANTGLHPLSEVIRNGGGDCGNLSSVFVSLLRCKGIPSRHLVSVRPDGSCHVWADFLLQNYGWIPVDVTYKNANPNGEFFGRNELRSNGIIMNSRVSMELPLNGGETRSADLLQSFCWWYHGTGSGGMTARYTFVTSPVVSR
jgi:hypothetical protein